MHHLSVPFLGNTKFFGRFRKANTKFFSEFQEANKRLVDLRQWQSSTGCGERGFNKYVLGLIVRI